MQFRGRSSITSRTCTAIVLCCAAIGQTPKKAPPTEVAGIPVNYDEGRVGTYTLPEPLVLANGKPVPAPKGGFGRINPAPFLAQGIAVAAIYYGDIDPDFLGGIPMGVRAPYLKPGE